MDYVPYLLFKGTLAEALLLSPPFQNGSTLHGAHLTSIPSDHRCTLSMPRPSAIPICACRTQPFFSSPW